MTKKIKFFDSVYFRGDADLLEFRLNELNEYVEHFIIADFDPSFNLTTKDWFQKWSHKISHVVVDEETFINKIIQEFINLKPDFEDVLLFSEINEIPNLETPDKMLNKLKYGAVILEHINFCWNLDYFSTDLFRGTVLFSFSLILRERTSMEFTFKNKFKSSIDLDSIVRNGWRFSNFNYDEKYRYQIEELLPPTEIDPVRTYQLIKHNGSIPLPKNLHLLPYFKIGRDEVKKHLFLVNSDLEVINQDYYDTITIINFDSNIQEILCEKVSDKITKSVLYLPSKVLYGNPETFHDEYMMNETKRMFSVVFPQEQDVIEIIFKNEKPLVLGGVSN